MFRSARILAPPCCASLRYRIVDICYLPPQVTETSVARKKRMVLVQEEADAMAQQRSGPGSGSRGFLRALVTSVSRSQRTRTDTIAALRAEARFYPQYDHFAFA